MGERAVHLLSFALIAAAGLSGIAAAQDPDWSTLPYTMHSTYQAVDSAGTGTFPVNTSGPIKLQGVLLNNPEEMLNPTPSGAGIGGQWQVFVQSTAAGDHGGTALWMGQNYAVVGHPPSYTDVAWLSELERLSRDPATGHVFQPGDRVEIRARAPGLFRGGKTNINEQHSTDPAADFDLVLIEAAAGLPAPQTLTLGDLKNASDGFLFDSTRLTGPEHYQGSLVRLNDVHFTSTTGWGPGAGLTVTDASGRTFPVLLGLGSGFTNFAQLTGSFDLVGILDQEDLAAGDGYMHGYRIWVTDYDGNGRVLPEPGSITLLGIAGLTLLGKRRKARS